jgi:hypothetical protein
LTSLEVYTLSTLKVKSRKHRRGIEKEKINTWFPGYSGCPGPGPGNPGDLDPGSAGMQKPTPKRGFLGF